jgi:hypothetical protein
MRLATRRNKCGPVRDPKPITSTRMPPIPWPQATISAPIASPFPVHLGRNRANHSCGNREDEREERILDRTEPSAAH